MTVTDERLEHAGTRSLATDVPAASALITQDAGVSLRPPELMAQPPSAHSAGLIRTAGRDTLDVFCRYDVTPFAADPGVAVRASGVTPRAGPLRVGATPTI